MNSVKKILLVHGDQAASRTLTLLLAGSGYYVRCCARPEEAIEAAHGEWFDLSLVADPLPEMSTFGLIEALKKLQPSMVVLLLVNQIELPSVIKSIRFAVTDVLVPDGDWAPVLQRVNGILRQGAKAPAGDVTPEELAAAEAILAEVNEVSADAQSSGTDPGGAAHDHHGELVRLARERNDLKGMVERLAQEKTAIEAELKAQLERQSVAVRQEAELTELRSEREIVAAAQAAVDEKARALVDAREAVARERAALAAERAEGCTAEEVQRLKSTEALSDERETLEGWRTDLRAEEVRLREEAVKVRQEQIRFEMDRQQLREDLDLLREQETNLRSYERQLRTMGEEAEASRVRSAAPRPSRDPFERDSTLEAAWTRLDRAMDMLEAERRNFTGEKLVLKEEVEHLKAQEEALQQRERALDAREAQLSAPVVDLEPPPPSFSHSPLKAAKAIFTGVKK